MFGSEVLPRNAVFICILLEICKPNVLRAIFNWRPANICCQFVDVCSLVLFVSLLCNTKPMDCTLMRTCDYFPLAVELNETKETELDTVKGLLHPL